MDYKYKYIVCGGTFDRLHAGHRAFLTYVFSQGEKVDIGLTTDAYVQKEKGSQAILSFEERKKELVNFLQENNFLHRANIIPITNVYGLTLDEDKLYEAIIVTEDTITGAQKINSKRQEKGLMPLPIITVPFLTIPSGNPLSSTLVREGTIGRQGEVYLNKKWTNHTLILPQDVRKLLHEPFGELITGDIPKEYKQNSGKTVVVGDATTKRFNEKNFGQGLSVIDFTIEREKKFSSIEELGFRGNEKIVALKNKPGTLASSTWEVLEKVLANKIQIVLVDGEEDLLVIPLVLLVPLGYTIFYGQPGHGVVRVMVSEQAKEKVFEFLQKFTHS